MFHHSRAPQILDTVPATHPLYGRDIRGVGDVYLTEAAARALLPSLEKKPSSRASGSPELHREVADHTGSVIRRVGRVLVQHVRIGQVLGSGAPNLETQDEVLEMVTLAFIHMAGAFDAVAIVNGLLAGNDSYRDMGWQKKRFRQMLRTTLPEAADLMRPDAPGGLLLLAILSLRNTIHRRMPDPATKGRADGDPALTEMTLILERRSHGEIFEAFESVGWTRYVGIERAGEHLFVRPETVVRLLIRDGVPVLDKLLELTPYDGAGRERVDPDQTLYPTQLRRYAVDYMSLSALLPPTTH